MKQFTMSKTIELGDGFYKSGIDIIRVEGNRIHSISFIGDNVYYSLRSDGSLRDNFQIITEQEWKDAVANLISTIYLSLPIEGVNENAN